MNRSSKQSRQRRAQRSRYRIRASGLVRLCITKSNQYIYAQFIQPGVQDKVLGAVSTNQAELKAELKGKTSNKIAAKLVGAKAAALAKKLNITEVAFDRSGNQYHGRIEVLAQAARDGGLKI